MATETIAIERKKTLLYGGGLKVDNVQDLAASVTDGVPDRYIRPEVATEAIINYNEQDIPVIDLGKLLDPLFSADEEAKLKIACEDWGIFQLINHGVPEEVTKNLKTDLEAFFHQPIEVKKEFATLPDNYQGYGQLMVLSEDQKRDWSDRYFLELLPVANRRMNLWSTHPPTFRTTLDKYATELKRMSDCLLVSMSKNLGLHPEKLPKIFEDSLVFSRINYYPPCAHPEKVVGFNRHTDRLGLTILYVADEASGLQVRKDGGWLPVKPLPGAFIVNMGDMLEILTNEKYKSVEHRAMVNTVKERLSVASFTCPQHDVMLAPIKELVEGGKVNYKPITVGDYRKLTYFYKFDGRNMLDDMKI